MTVLIPEYHLPHFTVRVVFLVVGEWRGGLNLSISVCMV